MNLKNFLVAGALLAGALFYSGCVTNTQTAGSPVQRLVFTGVSSEKKFALKEFNPDLPSDWSGYKYLVIEMRTSTPQRFSICMKFAWIPPGEFTMGTPGNNTYEKPHRVKLTKGFHMGIHPVTQAQWQAVMGNNPSRFKGDDLPVEMVSWTECVAFCEKLGKGDGKQYRLPTEAEWEYACRAGSQSTYYFGDDPKLLGDYAWFNGNANGNTHPVGQKKANAWGLFDMHGNVCQWCEDWYDANYYSNSPTDHPVNTTAATGRVLRGGSWGFSAGDARSAYRYDLTPDFRVSSIGFRVVVLSAP